MTPSLVSARVDHLRELLWTAPCTLPEAKNRLYHDVLRAVADGSEESRRIAMLALRAEDVAP